jgi:hypothetical protein
MAERKEEVILSFEVDEEEAIESIDSLTKANKELRKERNALNLATEEGRKRAEVLNKTIDSNTKKIKDNVSAIEQQKINIGNYKSALDGVHPALGKVGEGLEAGANGFKAMARQALAFIATPIGATLAALVAVFTLIKTAISQNNQVLDKFENITNAVSVVVGVVVARIGKLGEALIALVSGNFNEAINLTGEAFGGLAEEIGNAVTQQQMFLDLARELEDAQRALRVEQARQENVIKALVVAAKNRNLSFDEQEAKIRQALKLEEELVAKRAENAQKDLIITARTLRSAKEFQQQTNETFDQYLERLITGGKLRDEEVDKLIDKIEALEQARGSSLAFQEKLENSLSAIQEKRAAALEKQNEALREQADLERATRRARGEIDTSTENPLVDAFQTQANVITDIDKRLGDDLVKRNKETELQIVRDKKRSAELQEQIERDKTAIVGGFVGSLADLVEQDSVEHKVLASAQALINTYLAATAALASGSEINPIFGIISAGTAIATGLASVAKINGIEFWTGGYTGPGNKYERKGFVHANEVVWNQEDVQAVGGPDIANAMRPTSNSRNTRGYNYYDGGLVTNSVTQPIDSQLQLANIVKNMPPGVLDVRDVTREQKKIKVKQAISKR